MNPKNWKNDQKDAMWSMFEMGGIKFDESQIEFLKENLDTLIAAAKQKTSGQRGKGVDWDTLDITLMNIAIAATCLYKSGALDTLMKTRCCDG